jgi:hypothetical protein
MPQKKNNNNPITPDSAIQSNPISQSDSEEAFLGCL